MGGVVFAGGVYSVCGMEQEKCGWWWIRRLTLWSICDDDDVEGR